MFQIPMYLVQIVLFHRQNVPYFDVILGSLAFKMEKYVRKAPWKHGGGLTLSRNTGELCLNNWYGLIMMFFIFMKQNDQATHHKI